MEWGQSTVSSIIQVPGIWFVVFFATTMGLLKFILRVPDNNLYLHFRVRLLFDRYMRYEHSFCPDIGL